MTPATPTEPPDVTEEGTPSGEAPERRVITQPYDFSIRTLVDSIHDGGLIIQDVYQRYFVWDAKRSSKLIESLFLNIPIPVCYFAEDEQGRHSVVDGHQRLESINSFYLNKLKIRGLEVLPHLNDRTYNDLSTREKRAFLTKTIRCIVIMKESDPDMKFDVFERLNTGAISLNAQEVRNCVFSGPFNDLLRDLVEQPNVQRALGNRVRDDRMRDCELLLRYLALDKGLEDYTPSMKSFLNSYMKTHRAAPPPDIELFRGRVIEVIEKARAVFGDHCFRIWNGKSWERTINRAVFDAVSLSIADSPLSALSDSAERIQSLLQSLCSSNEDFLDASIKATGDKARLYKRVRLFAEGLRDLGFSPGVLGRFTGTVKPNST